MIRKQLLAAFVAAVAVNAAAADTYVVDKTHSEASFQVRHMMVAKVRGYFTDFGGSIQADAARPESSSVEFTVKTASVNTANEKRDAHLRSADFFEADKHPEMTFKSTRIKPLGEDKYEVTGNFTLKGVTKEITVPVTFLGLSPNKAKAGFETSFTINRKDYGLLWNRALDGGGIAVSDDVQVTVNVEADLKKDAPATQ
jgi:polyisoprenoid-binding protein YceI